MRPALPTYQGRPGRAGERMPSQRSFRVINDPVFGKGYRLYNTWGWFTEHFPGPRVYVVRYVKRSNRVPYCTVVIPWGNDRCGNHQRWKEFVDVDYLSKAAKAATATASKDAEVLDEAFMKKCPALFAFMSQLKQEGKPRELCKVQVFACEGTWRAALHDTNTEHSLFVTIGTPGEAFTALEKALTKDQPDWRPWKGKGKGKGK